MLSRIRRFPGRFLPRTFAWLPTRPLACASFALLSACVDRSERLTGSPASAPDIAQYVTGAAAAQLGPDGRFSLQEPAPREHPMISREQAAALALAYVRSYAQFMKASWEEERRAPIHVASLVVEPRVYFMETPYGRFPEGPYHPAFRRAFGPYFVATLSDGREPVLVVAVSAYNTDVWIDERGLVHETPLGGNEFMSLAVPAGPGQFRFPSPEQAVERVGRASGARATRAPELVARGGYHPAFALWRVPLDRRARVRAAGAAEVRSAQEVFVDGEDRFFVPAAAQPEEAVHEFPIGPPWERELRRTMPARIPVVPGRAVRYEEVVVEPEP